MSDLVNAVLRTDLPSFIHKCFTTLEPGRPFHPNWHIDHIAWNLGRISAGEATRLIITIPPPASEIHLRHRCLYCLGPGPRPQFAHHRRVLCRRAGA